MTSGPDDDLARAQASACYLADTCALDRYCPFYGGCRLAELAPCQDGCVCGPCMSGDCGGCLDPG